MALKLLIVEDDPDDAELVVRELMRSGLDPSATRVSTPEEFAAALDQGGWDVILADHSMPRFGAMQALSAMQGRGLDLPFIIVSGVIGEEAAVEALRRGAHDFVSKNNLSRLAPAVQREVREAVVRKERAEAKARLREVEARHRRMVESVRDYAIFMLDPAGRVATWNPGAERLMGYRDVEVLGRPLSMLGDGADGGGEATLTSALREDRPREGPQRRKDGSRFWAECAVDPIREEGHLVGYSVVIRDTSERKRLIDDLRQAVRMREDFLSVASHELKTPLTSLHLLLDTYSRAVAGDPSLPASAPKLAGKWEAIRRQVDRLTTLVEVLLDVDRIATGQLELDREPLELGDVAASVIARLQPLVEASGCTVSLVRRGVVDGRWDRVRLETILSNLLSNALKYASGKPIDVTVDADGPNALIEVKDRGIGLSPNDAERIFEQFERAVPSTHYGGLGLGLWIARQSARAHGGTIHVTSLAGRGATFTVVLPRDERKAAAPDGDEPHAPA